MSDVDDTWKSLIDRYPKWSSDFDPTDPIDIVVRAMDDDREGSFFKMTHLFNVNLSKKNSIGMEFAYIPPGKFIMGSPFDEPGRGKDENQSTVTIGRGFFIQVTEVTQQQWQTVMGRNPSNFDSCGLDCPVENVSWKDTIEFIDRLNELENTDTYRLPKETEWEYAARAGSTGWFSFGSDENKFMDYGWYKNNAGGKPHPVAQKKTEWVGIV